MDSKKEYFLKKDKALFLAYDQGFEHGPKDFNLKNVDPQSIIDIAEKSKSYTGIILLPGTAEKYYDVKKNNVPLIVKLNSKTSFNHDDPLSLQNCSVKRAKKLGAKAVGYTIYPGSKYEQQMYVELGRIIEEAHKENLKVIVWSYPRGNNVDEMNTDVIAYAARIASELGADYIKLKYNNDKPGFEWILKNSGKAKVLVSGGSKKSLKEEFEIIKEVLSLGASGIAIGRNVWQDEKPISFSKAIEGLVFKNYSVEKALEVYNKGKK